MDKVTSIELKKGIKLHIINTNKFKTNLISVFLTSKLSRETITKKALILSILRRGNNTLKTQEEINAKLEDLYGAECDCGIDKNGDNHISKFYIETLNDNYILNNENIFEEAIQVLFDIIFNPISENNKFKDEYFDGEKETLKQIIEARKDNKRAYSTIRCIEEMYKDEPYGLYKYGDVEDLEKITNEELFEEYKNLINNSKIDIFVSGNIDEQKVEEIFKNNKYIKELCKREYVLPEEVNKENETKTVIEKTNVAQGNLNIGMKVNNISKDDVAKVAVYNAVLGGGANSKLFQNVREKASLAYSAGSMFIKTKKTIIIKCGIDPENYEKTLKIVNKQLDDMKNGDFSEEDMNKAKELIVASCKSMQDEQDSELSYYFNKELNEEKTTIEEYIKDVQAVSKEDVINVANNVKTDTIYFLTKEENANE